VSGRARGGGLGIGGKGERWLETLPRSGPGLRSLLFLNLLRAKRQAVRDQPSLVNEALIGGVTHSLSTPFPEVGGGLAF